jgi:hypothetical protein
LGSLSRGLPVALTYKRCSRAALGLQSLPRTDPPQPTSAPLQPLAKTRCSPFAASRPPSSCARCSSVSSPSPSRARASSATTRTHSGWRAVSRPFLPRLSSRTLRVRILDRAGDTHANFELHRVRSSLADVVQAGHVRSPRRRRTACVANHRLSAAPPG